MLKLRIGVGVFLLCLFGKTKGEFFEYDYTDYEYVDYEEWEKIFPPKDPKDHSKDLTLEGWKLILKEEEEKLIERGKLDPIARPVPLCVDGLQAKLPGTLIDEDLERFRPIIDESDKIKTELIPSDENGKSPGNTIEKIEFYSIYSPDPPSQSNVDGIGIGRLNQWVHIVITASKDLEGLYIQGISGPLGIPFGEFRTDFECKIDGKQTDVNPYPTLVPSEASLVVPCKFRPRTSVRHPTVYVYGGSTRIYVKPKKKFHVHFNWEDVKCAEATRMQFLILAVTDFRWRTYEAIKTASYEQKVDSYDGAPYPYYIQWSDGMVCKNDDMTQDKYRFIYDPKSSAENIIYNLEYDNCIRTGKGFIGFISCPPGPLLCKKRQDNTPEDVDKQRDSYNVKTTFVKACPNGPTSCKDVAKTEKKVKTTTTSKTTTTTVTTPESTIMTTTVSTLSPVPVDVKFEKVTEDFTIVVLGKSTRESNALHSQMMLFSYILGTLGIFIGRFYKETGGLNAIGTNGCLGIGPWLWGHTLLSIVAVSSVWVGVFEIVRIHDLREIPCDKYISGSEFETECLTKHWVLLLHIGFGMASILCLHICFVSGFIRPVETKIRKVFALTHFTTGYVGKIFAFSSVIIFFNTKAICRDIVAQVLLLEIVNIIFFVVMSVVQKKEDKILEIDPPRSHFPMIDAIEAPWGGSPSDCTKKVLHIAGWVINILLYTGIVFSYINIYGNVHNGLTNQFDVPACLLFECKVPSLKTDLLILQCLDNAPGATGDCNSVTKLQVV